MSSRMPAVSSRRRERVQIGELGPGDRLHLGGRWASSCREPGRIMLRSGRCPCPSERRYHPTSPFRSAVPVEGGWVRYSEVRFSISTGDEEPASVSTPAAAGVALATSSSVVVSSQAIATWSSSTRRRSIPTFTRRLDDGRWHLPGTCASTVSKRWCTIAEQSPSAICAARPWVRRAIAARPSGPWWALHRPR